ncbi:MAG: hypothetical protein M5U26_05740 [Planctomycetota bacterium]|nr:hypothetical protein [Planctomycetota bacterium]
MSAIDSSATDTSAPIRVAESHAAPLYFLGPWPDLLAMGGFGLLLWGALRVAGDPALDPEATGVAQALAWAAVLFHYPHFAAAAWPLYSRMDRIKRHAATALIWPLVLLAVMLVCLRHSTTFLPFFCKLALLWIGYHYAAQTHGLGLLYLRRAGFPADRVSRLLLGSIAFAPIFYALVCLDIRVQGADFGRLAQGIRPLGLPDAFPLAALAGVCLSVAGVAALAIHLKLKHERALPPVVLLPAAVQLLWFVPGAAECDPYVRFASFGLVHGLQYLALAAVVEIKEVRTQDPSLTRAQLGRDVLLYYVILIAFGAAAFVGLPWLLGTLRVARHVLEPTLIALLWAHHAFLDGVLWKPRTPAAAALADFSFAQLPEPEAQP